MKTILITGAASGIGKSTAILLAEQNFQVIATDIDAPGLDQLKLLPNVHAFVMDVSDPDSIRAGFDKVSLRYNGLDALVNAAGIYLAGPMTEVPAAAFERAIEVNLMGAYRVSQTFLPLLLDQKGRVINIGSETHQFTNIFGHYAITKRALEAFTDALRQELDLIGIPVISIRPGAHETGVVVATRKFPMADLSRTRFQKSLEHFHRFTLKKLKSTHPPLDVGRAVLKACTSKNPRYVYRVNNDITVKILSFLPYALTLWINRKILMK